VFLGVVWEGDQLLERLMTDFERRYDPASTTRSNSRPTASFIRYGRMLSLANAAIPGAQRRMVEPESANTASPNKSTSSTLNPGPSEHRDPVTIHSRLRLQIDRRVHTCGRRRRGGLS
jgi:hypothetical protein